MLSDNIQHYRKEKGLSQEELAAQLHVVRQTVSKWERGISVPDATLLMQLAEQLEVPVSTLLGVEAQDLCTDALAEELARLNAELAATQRHTALLKEAASKRNLILFLCILPLIVMPLMPDERFALLLCGGCALSAVVLLYRNLALLTRVSTDDLRLGTLRLTTLVNIGFIVLALAIALLSHNGVLAFSEHSERLLAMCFVCALMVFVGFVSPHLPFQRHTGLRLPWTVRDEDTWHFAHRIVGIISLPLALLYIAASLIFDDFDTVSLVTIALWVGIPGVLSYLFYWKKFHGRL